MLSTFLDKAGGLLNRRFLVAYWFPTLFAALLLLLPRVLVYGVEASGRWWMGLAPPKDYTGVGALQSALLIGALFLITLTAYLLPALTRPLVRLYEGYGWPAPLFRRAVAGAMRRWRALKAARAEAAHRNDLGRYTHLQDRLYYKYPAEAWQLLPTRLGRVLRAAEGYAGRAYGMDAPFWWPRLWPLLPEAAQEAVEDGLTTMLSLLNLTTLLIYVVVDDALYLNSCRIAHRAWWVLGALVLGGLLASIAYLGAVAQARGYGQQIRTAVDLHRFALLEALHCPLPTTPLEERALWEQLAAWLYNNDLGVVRQLVYDSGKRDQRDGDPGSGEGEEIVRSLWQRLWGK